jgi:hypothetical protein
MFSDLRAKSSLEASASNCTDIRWATYWLGWRAPIGTANSARNQTVVTVSTILAARSLVEIHSENNCMKLNKLSSQNDVIETTMYLS